MPATIRRPLDATAAALMTVFCAGLGLQQVAIKVIADDVSPIAQIAICSAIAALMVLGVARAQNVRLSALGQLLPGVAVGAGFTLAFTFVAVGLNLYPGLAHGGVFIYLARLCRVRAARAGAGRAARAPTRAAARAK